MILLKCDYYTNTFIHTNYTRMILLKCDYYTNTLIHTKYTRMILLKCDYLLNKQLNKMRRTSMVSSACTFTSMSNKVFCLRRRWCKGAVGCSYFLRLRYPSSNWYLPLLSTGLGPVGWWGCLLAFGGSSWPLSLKTPHKDHRKKWYFRQWQRGESSKHNERHWQKN